MPSPARSAVVSPLPLFFRLLVVAGYPKSGTTWVVQLVAELIGGPVVGFGDSAHDEIAREGLERPSEFRCFKSHHQLGELRAAQGLRDTALIYVIRDPRDVTILASAQLGLFRDVLAEDLQYFGYPL